jgi:hypothetical protein
MRMMGEEADYYIDKYIDNLENDWEPRKVKSYQSGSGNFAWRTSDNLVMDMHTMSDEHIINAITLCSRFGNTGKKDQLQQVLRERRNEPKDNGYRDFLKRIGEI